MSKRQYVVFGDLHAGTDQPGHPYFMFGSHAATVARAIMEYAQSIAATAVINLGDTIAWKRNSSLEEDYRRMADFHDAAFRDTGLPVITAIGNQDLGYARAEDYNPITGMPAGSLSHSFDFEEDRIILINPERVVTDGSPVTLRINPHELEKNLENAGGRNIILATHFGTAVEEFGQRFFDGKKRGERTYKIEHNGKQLSGILRQHFASTNRKILSLAGHMHAKWALSKPSILHQIVPSATAGYDLRPSGAFAVVTSDDDALRIKFMRVMFRLDRDNVPHIEDAPIVPVNDYFMIPGEKFNKPLIPANDSRSPAVSLVTGL